MLKLISDYADCNDPFRELIERAKLVLPLEKMLEKLDDWDVCVAEKRCPFHVDHSPSFSVFTKDEQQYWKCHAGCGGGDQINYLELKFELSRGDALRLFLNMADVSAAGEGEVAYE